MAALEVSSVWQLLQQDKNLLKIARIPFWLNVICISHTRLSLEDLQQLTLESHHFQYLLDAYVEEMLQRGLLSKWMRKDTTPSSKQTKRWLAYLAKKINRESRTEFLAGKIQIPISCFLDVSRETTSRQQTLIFFVFLTVSVLSPLILFGFIFYWLFMESRTLIIWLSLVVLGLFIFLILMGNGKSIFGKAKWAGTISGLSLAGAYLWIYKLINNKIFPFTVALCKTMSKPTIEYFIRPLFLLRYGYFPWNSTQFTSYCTECFFLQRVGKRHRFIHKLLLDHFARME